MLKPSISDLVEQMGTRYKLVNATAKRARRISEFADGQEVTLPQKPIRIAITEISEGKLHIVPGSAE